MSSHKELKIISEEEAQSKGYISLHDDYLDTTVRDAEFITLTPDPNRPPGSNREIVTYYLSRTKFRSRDIQGEGNEWVYILSNPVYGDNIIKIGYTASSPELRKETIDKSTGVPVPFHVEYAKQCRNGRELEQAVHQYLSKERINPNKEFFQISIEDAKQVIDRIHSQIENSYK
jgi:hypothetical protein